jgi:uncharacterized SAM-binding protein YcdF (DUF218 family)
LYDFLKHGLLPGTVGLLLLLLVICWAALRMPRFARAGIYILALTTILYWISSTPAGALFLGRIVSAGYAPVDSATIGRIDAIVVLDAATQRYRNGTLELALVTRPSAVRALETIRLYHALRPQLVIVSGGANERSGIAAEGAALRDVLVANGVPGDRVSLDSASRDTREQGKNVALELHSKGITRFALVTSAVHMRRAMRAFDDSGLQAVPAPAPLDMPGRFAWWPSTAGLDRSYDAWYEIFAMLRDVMR